MYGKRLVQALGEAVFDVIEQQSGRPREVGRRRCRPEARRAGFELLRRRMLQAA